MTKFYGIALSMVLAFLNATTAHAGWEELWKEWEEWEEEEEMAFQRGIQQKGPKASEARQAEMDSFEAACMKKWMASKEYKDYFDQEDLLNLNKRSTKITYMSPSLTSLRGTLTEERTWFRLGRTPYGTITETVPPLRVAGAIPFYPATSQQPSNETMEDVESFPNALQPLRPPRMLQLFPL